MQDLKEQLIEEFGEGNIIDAFGELTLTVDVSDIIKSCLKLRESFLFDTLVDLCGVDYLTYGQSDWDANASSSSSLPHNKLSQKSLATMNLFSPN
jgi:NADH-quinone oxidoreductase subunit C